VQLGTGDVILSAPPLESPDSWPTPPGQQSGLSFFSGRVQKRGEPLGVDCHVTWQDSEQNTTGSPSGPDAVA
jgi:hypothetical protein